MKTLFLALIIFVITIPSTTASSLTLISQPNPLNRTMLDRAELDLELKILETINLTDEQKQQLIKLEIELEQK